MSSRSVAALLLTLCAARASAWGPVGHMAVGMIAEARLSPRTAARVRELLGSATLDQVANCPDNFAYGRIRDCAGVFEMPGDFDASKPWHFIDIDVEKQADESTIMRFCPTEGCAPVAIKRDLATLADPGASKLAKQAALTYLVHFVGDIHQPLHCAEHHHDMGGNKKGLDVSYVDPSGKAKKLNLHSAWDAAIDTPKEVSFGEPHEKLVAAARKLADRLNEELSAQDAGAWTAAPDVTDRAVIESWQLARELVYPSYLKANGQFADASGEDYRAELKAELRPVAYGRVKAAGVRLAALLEQTLGR